MCYIDFYMEYKTISADEFVALLNSGKALNIIDVRDKPEHSEKHLVAPHRNLPVNELKPSEAGDVKDNIYVLCGGGKRAVRAAQILSNSGFANATVITGGLRSCINAGADTAGSKTQS